MLHNSAWSGANEKFVLRVRDITIIEALNDGKDVIVDDTNFDSKHELRIKEIIEKLFSKEQVKIEIKVFDIDVEEAIRRDQQRSNPVGEKVIRNMYNRYIKTDESVKLVQDSSLQHCIICDIDGTLALRKDRSPFDWKKVDTDLPNESVCNLIKSLAFDSNRKIIFVSGRKEICRDLTKEWIFKYIGNFDSDFVLFMRGNDDNRPDEILKSEIFTNNILGKYYIDFVVDDREKVVKKWREMGLTCLQVAEGKF